MNLWVPDVPGVRYGTVVVQTYNSHDGHGGRTMITASRDLQRAVLATPSDVRARAVQEQIEAYELFWRYPERWTLQAYRGSAG
jgi:hypothetical protein